MSRTIWRIAPGSHSAVVVVRAIGRPRGLVVLPDGKLAASDYQHNVLEIVDPATGVVTPLAGAWDSPGMADGTGNDARFSVPYGMAVRGDGAILVADFDNQRIRVVTRAGVTTTLAGTGIAGFADGDLGTAMFHRPQGIAITADGDVYVSDSDNFRVRRITGTAVQTIAGDGTGGAWEREQPNKHEFFHGQAFALAGGTPRHNALGVSIGGELRAVLRPRGCSVLSSDQRLAFPLHERYVYPDVTVICGPPVFQPGTDDVITNPTILVEVLSSSTEEYDRGLKWAGYRRRS